MGAYDRLRELRLLTTASLADCRRALAAAGDDLAAALAALQAGQAAELARATGAPLAACAAALRRSEWVGHRAALELALAYPPPPPPPLIAPDSEARIRAVLAGDAPAAALRSAEELHYCAWAHNWDDGVASLHAIIAHPLCAQGTALLIYWYGNPSWLHDPQPSPTAAIQESAGVHDLLRAIEAGVLAGRFSQSIAFDPADDQGRNWVLEYDGPPEQALVPAPLRQPSSGRMLPWWGA